MNWLISANSNLYDHTSSFEHYGFIDWRQGNISFSVGDIVYIYCTKPVMKIRYQCRVEQIDLTKDAIRNDKEYWRDLAEYEKSLDGKYMHLVLIDQVELEALSLKFLLSNGLSSAPQGPMRLTGDLLSYVEKSFDDSKQMDFFPDIIAEETSIYEGIKKTAIVNKYERSSIARAKCIEYHGSKCIVCGVDFRKQYGELGAGFIHVHHVIPIYQIDKQYKVDYKNDLKPVCPNCHAMLHRKLNDKFYTIEELKEIVEGR
ncbi:MAG TPA: HNH endonuclease [Spirochaetota bacterium]|jgi:5-methylcytosine-specific restriction protein A|nr:HNH endonuclease [Spirochaetota bacterium]HOH37575.1 HNH endonuclease [Spirochaetota bacterium]HPW51188.1 HNH endonuclease [Spirochaetota bacterium]HPY03269.1 HNH endonuclease [Spirochaetota bacterium]HQA52852.1 HNH endonuclease [Spirochaetota bacterium]